jgi:hypothetical protein
MWGFRKACGKIHAPEGVTTLPRTLGDAPQMRVRRSDSSIRTAILQPRMRDCKTPIGANRCSAGKHARSPRRRLATAPTARRIVGTGLPALGTRRWRGTGRPVPFTRLRLRHDGANRLVSYPSVCPAF